jgi:hypothetical protein
MFLAECDRRGRSVGVMAPDMYDALRYIRELSEMCGE